MRLFMAKKDVSVQHHANVFISRANESAIIVALHFNGRGGFLFEENAPVVLLSPLDPMVLGQGTLAALKRTQVCPAKSFVDNKLTDWPAFKASRVSSVRRFQQEYIQIQVSGANEANLYYVIDGEPAKEADLHVVSSINSGLPPIELGERIILVFRACRDRRI